MFRSTAAKENGLPIGEQLPDIRLPGADGREVALLDPSRDNVLAFISLSCAYCIDLLPHLETISRNDRYRFTLLSTGDDEDHREMVAYFGWNFPIVRIRADQMDARFQVRTMPFMMLADREGRVLAKGVVYDANGFDKLTAKGRA